MNFLEIDRSEPGICVLTLNRPERMNAMAFDVMVPLRRALEEVSDDNTVRAVILTGAGRAFCSGADLEDPGMVPNIDNLGLANIARRSMGLLEEVVRTIRRMHQPVIAAVNGPAIGGGFCLALACDLRVVADTAYFRAAGINNGLTASELGLSYLLPRVIGHGRAADIMLTGRDVSADEALGIGLCSSVHGETDVVDAARILAARVASFSHVGVEMTKRSLWASLEAGGIDGHMEAEGLGQLYIRLLSKNFEEAIRARRDGRPPNFAD
jgi:enoyl-CoA hydratase